MKLTRKELALQLRKRSIFEVQQQDDEQLRAWCRWFGLSEKGDHRTLCLRIGEQMWRKEHMS